MKKFKKSWFNNEEEKIFLLKHSFLAFYIFMFQKKLVEPLTEIPCISKIDLNFVSVFKDFD